MSDSSTIVVTGGAGFIGSALVRYLFQDTHHGIVNVDKLTYAGRAGFLESFAGNGRYRFEKVDICHRREIDRILETAQPRAVMHLAAETHVDRSIDRPEDFIRTNMEGTFTLLEASLQYWKRNKRPDFRFLHVSTDEVYGSLDKTGFFTEASPYRPRSPYAASKASADHLVRAWHHTYGLPVVVTNCSNNYGPNQFPEKLIPLMIFKALRGEQLPLYGKGDQIRDWLHVDDHAEALYQVLRRGRVGETYNIGGRCEKTNLEVVGHLCALLDELLPDSPFSPHASLIGFVEDRPGHDQRYALDTSKMENELGWKPKVGFVEGLKGTVRWYLDHPEHFDQAMGKSYGGERLGLRLSENRLNSDAR